MVLIVIRSKLVLDFALTTHFLHLVTVSLVSGQVPRHFFWYVTMAASSAVGVALGIWGCQYRELRPVFFGGQQGGGGSGGGSGGGTQNTANGSAGAGGGGGVGGVGGNGEGSSGAADGIAAGDEEQGFSRGRGRGRGRDGAGEYEMVKMNGQAAP